MPIVDDRSVYNTYLGYTFGYTTTTTFQAAGVLK